MSEFPFVDAPLGIGIRAPARGHDLDATLGVADSAPVPEPDADFEARALRRLDGDRIVRVYELAHLASGRPFMSTTTSGLPPDAAKTRCASRSCANGACACVANHEPCGADADCCSGKCGGDGSCQS